MACNRLGHGYDLFFLFLFVFFVWDKRRTQPTPKPWLGSRTGINLWSKLIEEKPWQTDILLSTCTATSLAEAPNQPKQWHYWTLIFSTSLIFVYSMRHWTGSKPWRIEPLQIAHSDISYRGQDILSLVLYLSSFKCHNRQKKIKKRQVLGTPYMERTKG